jgi:hypothetical protein
MCIFNHPGDLSVAVGRDTFVTVMSQCSKLPHRLPEAIDRARYRSSRHLNWSRSHDSGETSGLTNRGETVYGDRFEVTASGAKSLLE